MCTQVFSGQCSSAAATLLNSNLCTGVQGVGLTKSNDVLFLQPVLPQRHGMPLWKRNAATSTRDEPSAEAPLHAQQAVGQGPAQAGGESAAAYDVEVNPEGVLADAAKVLDEADAATREWVMRSGKREGTLLQATATLFRSCLQLKSAVDSMCSVLRIVTQSSR